MILFSQYTPTSPLKLENEISSKKAQLSKANWQWFYETKNNKKCFVSHQVWKIFYEHKKKKISSKK